MSGTSGRILPVPLGFYDPDTRSLRTSRTTFESDSMLSSPTLPASGSMLSGVLYARTRSELRISGSGSSSSPLLPTPRTSDTNGAGVHGEGGLDLRTTVALLPTPTASAKLKSTRALSSSKGNGRREGGGQSSSLGLPEVATLAAGQLPENLPPMNRLPPSSRAVVEQMHGADSPRPSAGGNTSSDDPSHEQLTISLD